MAGSGAVYAQYHRFSDHMRHLRMNPLRERDFCRRRQTRKKALETMSPSEDQRLETTTREKWPQKRPFC